MRLFYLIRDNYGQRTGDYDCIEMDRIPRKYKLVHDWENNRVYTDGNSYLYENELTVIRICNCD